jgi:putative DeoR family transcriptional regulator (stage III sporulation protein D)
MMYISCCKERCVMLGTYLVENRTTVRATAQQFNISKSTVHKDITQVLQRVNPALYEQVQRVLEQNKDERHLRGGEATKKKYLYKNIKNNG